jgi:hypothetical protein
MSITSADDRVTSYNPVVATTNFAADFPVFDLADISVYVDGVERFDFTPAGTFTDGISNNATAIFSSGITGAVQVVGVRDPHRTNRFSNGGPLPISSQNLALDTVEAELQEARRDISRGILAPIGTTGLTLSSDIDDGDTLMKQGNSIVKGPDAAEISSAQEYAEDAHDSQLLAKTYRDQASAFADFARNNWVAIGPFVGTGNEADYLLTIDPGSANNMLVVVGGVAQLITGSAYALVYSGGNPYIRITVPDGIPFEVRLSNAININTPADGTVSTAKIANDAVTYAKMQNISATLRLLGRADHLRLYHPEIDHKQVANPLLWMGFRKRPHNSDLVFVQWRNQRHRSRRCGRAFVWISRTDLRRGRIYARCRNRADDLAAGRPIQCRERHD